MQVALFLPLIVLNIVAVFGKKTVSKQQSILSRIQTLLSSDQALSSNTTALQSLLASDCGALFEQSIDLSSYSNFTLFLPTDSAFGSFAALIRTGALRLNCQRQTNRNCTVNPFVAFATQGRGQLASLIACLPDLLKYHVVPNNTYIVGDHITNDSSNSFQNTTVLETSLNSTAFVNLDGHGQVIIANETDRGTFVNFGFGRPAEIVFPNVNLTLTNSSSASAYNNNGSYVPGMIQFVNSVLVPPFPLNETLQVANLTAFKSNLNSTDFYSMPNITVFAPTDEAMLSANGTVDASRYILPNSVIYANSTLLNSSFTNAANETISISVGNNTMVYGNTSNIIYPNIPISNGVLHIIDSVLSDNTTTTNTSVPSRAAGLSRRIRASA